MRPPLFLARAVYRRRRLRDAARLLPFAGLFALLLPALRPASGQAGGDAVYVFAVWAVLIGAAAVLAPGLARPDADTASQPGPQPEPEDDA